MAQYNFANNVTGSTLRDYQHAARVFVDGNMRLSPKLKHLYHVVLNINENIILTTNGLDNVAKREMHLLVKQCDLPGYQMRTETLNQYNRKKVIQTGVQYDPINMIWHDDSANLTNFLFQKYFDYYYSDANHGVDTSPPVTDPAYLRNNGLNSSYDNGEVMRYKFGLDRPNKADNFFTSIQIFQLHTNDLTPTSTSFTLINPIIESWDHDEVNSQGSEFATNRMRISYEAVIMDVNRTDIGNIPAGFGDYRYDQTPSPLGQATITSSINGRDNALLGSQSLNTNQKLFGSNVVVNASNVLANPGQAPNIVENVTSNTVANYIFPKNQDAQNITSAIIKRFI